MRATHGMIAAAAAALLACEFNRRSGERRSLASEPDTSTNNDGLASH